MFISSCDCVSPSSIGVILFSETTYSFVEFSRDVNVVHLFVEKGGWNFFPIIIESRVVLTDVCVKERT